MSEGASAAAARQKAELIEAARRLPEMARTLMRHSARSQGTVRSGVVLAPEQQNRPVGRIREGPCEYQFTSLLGFPGQTQVLASVGRPALQVVAAEMIKQKKMHDVLQDRHQLPAL